MNNILLLFFKTFNSTLNNEETEKNKENNEQYANSSNQEPVANNRVVTSDPAAIISPVKQTIATRQHQSDGYNRLLLILEYWITWTFNNQQLARSTSGKDTVIRLYQDPSVGPHRTPIR